MYRVPRKAGYLGAWHGRNAAIGIATLVTISWLVSEQIAAHYAYSPVLGPPLATFGQVRIYQPFSWLWWLFKLAGDKVLYQYSAAAMLGTIVVMLSAAVANANRNKHIADDSDALHGSARLATREDVEATGMLTSEDGVYVGGYYDEQTRRLHYLKDNSPGHVLAFAPTRSGKGVSLVIPTLLAWEHSVVAYDIKGELWNLTAGYRASVGNICLKFSPTEPGSRFNPLAEIRIGTPREVADSQTLSQMLVIPNLQSVDPAEKYFQEAAQALVTGLNLHALYAAAIHGRVACISDVAMLFQEPGVTLEEQLRRLLTFEHDPNCQYGWIDASGNPTKTHPVVAHAAQQMLNKKERDMSGVESTAVTAFRLFEDPILAANTSASDFRIADLMDNERPVSLYIVVPPSDKVRLRPVVQMLLTILANRLTETMEGARVPSHRHRLLFMVDEFPSLRRMEIFSDAMSYMAGYKIKAYLIAQDVEQLIEAYGQNQSIVSNCAIRVAFPPNNQKTAELLSQMVGERTVEHVSPTFSGSRAGSMLPNTSVTLSHIKRPLLTPQEVTGLRSARRDATGERITEPGEMLIFTTGYPAILGMQMLYFLDPTFVRRAAIPPPTKMPAISRDGSVVDQLPLERTERRLSPPEIMPPDAPVPAEPQPQESAPNDEIDPFFWKS